jgi:type VI secretion system protein
MTLLSRLCFAICLCIPLQGCADGALAGAIKMDQAKVWIERVNFKVSKKVNSNAPVDVHLIIIYDDGVMGQVSSMTAEQYFAAEDQLRKDHANDIDIVEWEVVPGQEMESENITMSKAYGKGAFFFARYTTPDTHREGLANEKEVTLHLDQKDFFLTKDR